MIDLYLLGLQKKHLFAIFIGIVGIVFFWRGIWQISEKLFSPEVSLAFGMVLLIVVALIERKLFFKFLGGM